MLLVGAGSLGSALAELLVRGGVSRLVIVDPQRLQAGNLVRHTLDLSAVQYSKAHALAQHLRNSSPDLKVHSYATSLKEALARGHFPVQRCRIVIDCTADDAVIEELGRARWDGPRLFFSASFGVGARCLMCFSARGARFPSETFWRLAEDWIRRELHELRSTDLPREGIGCWPPVFPARADDVALVAATAVKVLEQAVAAPVAARFELYERDEGTDGFHGVKRVARMEENPQP